MISLINFLRESNSIEGIFSDPTDRQVEIANNVITLPYLRSADVANFVEAFQPNAQIRAVHGMDVRVGDHFPPRGGPEIPKILDSLLKNIYPLPKEYNNLAMYAYETHVFYETLHPFTDGNGRSGRILWLHMMGGNKWLNNSPYGFLHTWYYHSLTYSRLTADKE